MKAFSHKSRMLLLAAFGIPIAAGLFAYRAQADQWDKKTVLTISHPIQVRERLLEPGQYVFKLLDSNSDRHIVQIFNGDQTRIVDTILAIPNYRLRPTGDSRFVFWETPPGTARALRAWFYPGDNSGQEFPYPKQLAMLLAPAPAPAPTPAAEPSRAKPPREEAPVPQQPQPQSMTTEPAPEKPVEMAQAAPPPVPAAPPEEQPAPKQQPETLPKTASPYPVIGLSGLLALGLGSLLGLKRAA